VSRSLRLLGVGLVFLLMAVWASPARAERDVVHFFNNIDVQEGATVQDTVCFFCNVNVKGTLNGDAVVFFGTVRIEGHANHDVVDFFGNVDAADDTSIGGDLVNFFGTTRLGENVTVGQDAVVMFGSLDEANSASIGHDRVVQSPWLFWVPFLLILGGFSFVVRELRMMRLRRMMRGY
jgi:hypothetical protein